MSSVPSPEPGTPHAHYAPLCVSLVLVCVAQSQSQQFQGVGMFWKFPFAISATSLRTCVEVLVGQEVGWFLV